MGAKWSARFAGLLAGAYRRITGRAPTERVEAAFEQFPFYALGTIAARAISLAAQLFLARLLGPEQFGRFGLALGMAMMLTTPLQEAWGAGFVRFAAIRPAGASPWHVLRAALLLGAASGAAVAALAALATPLLTVLLGVPPEVCAAGIALSLAATVWFAARSTCQGLREWRRLIAVDLGWAVLILAVPPLVGLVSGALDWRVLGVFAVAYLLAATPAIPLWWRTPEHPVAHQARLIWSFGKYLAAAGAINAFLFYGDRLVVNRGAGLHALGVYQAYALSTLTAASVASQTVNRFLFPFLNLGDRTAFRRLFRQTLPWAAAVFVPGTFLFGMLVVTLLRYPLHPAVLGVAALSGFALCTATFLNYLIATDDVRGPRVVLGLNAVACAIFFPLAVLLVRSFPLGAPFAAYAIALTATALLAYRWLLRDPSRPRAART